MNHKPQEQPFQPPLQGRTELWPGGMGFGDKTLWDWLQLLIVPVMLAIVGASFVFIQLQAEERRAQAQLDAEEQRAQDEALQTYLGRMGDLLLDEGLLSPQQGLQQAPQQRVEARTLARARTLTILGRIDGTRKRSVVQFLYESQLIQKDQPIVSLSGADLSGAGLSGAILSDANLSDAGLSGADLSDADLFEADLRSATLLEADLSNAELRGVKGFTTRGLELATENLKGTMMPDGTTHP